MRRIVITALWLLPTLLVLLAFGFTLLFFSAYDSNGLDEWWYARQERSAQGQLDALARQRAARPAVDHAVCRMMNRAPCLCIAQAPDWLCAYRLPDWEMVWIKLPVGRTWAFVSSCRLWVELQFDQDDRLARGSVVSRCMSKGAEI